MVEIIAIKGSRALVKTGATIVQANIRKLKRPLDTVDFFRTRVNEQERLSCRSLVKVKWMFGRRSRTTLILSAILDRHALQVAANLTRPLVQAQEKEIPRSADVES